jgi:hypothetical protein
MTENTQTAPYPGVLADLVDLMAYRPGWTFALSHQDRGQGSEGLTFIVTSLGYDTYNPDRGETYRVRHFFPVPPAAFNEQSWRRWLLDRMVEIETHECCEFFQIDGERPYAPQHGPGNDPYVIFEHGDELQRRTRFDGTVAPS